ncbi:heme-binding domain-containing protein [Chryseobacterium sp. CKR4-1]|uniref:heme-binding domain-containing protein n=1 Tax=Chryseobacterium sp. CKR4-1 TaxID=3068896 RepID=UPI0027968FDF|nr:heme-binding domain-containing protein [Chryseobacterium sp. CKR4-1]MDQ1803658.1 heme-binding domain-containing protein [Chryseobacterium sp. CKR4-1]
MKRVLKIFAAIMLLVFIAVQFYQPARNADKGQVYKTDFIKTHKTMPVEVKTLLQTSCYDCHSNNTNYQWYDYIQPARSLVDKHIKDAKEDLNFNEWATYSGRKQERLINSIKKQIETKKMPMSSYTLMHKDAKLNDRQIKLITDWLEKQE